MSDTPGAPEPWLAAAQRHIAESEYHASANAEGLQAPNRAHALRTYFDASGIRIHDRTAEASPQLLELRLAALGRGASAEALAPGEIASEAGRVEIRRAGLVEWYENTPAGLEQGFTLTERPAGSGALRLELSLAGARVSQRGADLRFATEAGRALDYGKLAAFDAEGDALEVAFRMVDDRRFAIEVGDEGATYPIVVDPLISEVAIGRIAGDQIFANLGNSVSNAGDVNGDGFDDVIVGAEAYDDGEVDEGAAFLFLGDPGGIAHGNPATAHARLTSNQAGAYLGRSVSTAGDANGDGFDDVIVGGLLVRRRRAEEGAAFVFLGVPSGIAHGNPATAHARLTSNQAGAILGESVSTAGDVNGDGFDDVIVGARGYDDGESGEGAAFVFLGGPSGIAHGNPATAHARLTSNQAGAALGISVSTAGDVNGDGFGDVIVGAFTYDDGESLEGAAFVFLGGPGGIAHGNPATAHARLTSNQANALLGGSVSAAGDVNGDGFDDVIVGAEAYDDGEVDEGAAFLFLGDPGGIAHGNPATAHARLTSNQAGAYLGRSVSTAGDVNGDGFDDVIVGAFLYDEGESDEGAAVVFLGGPSGIAHGNPATAHARLTSNQAGAILGESVSTAGDVNGDGFDDVIVGARGYDDGEDGEGAAFLYLGSPMTWAQDYAFALANEPTNPAYEVNPFYSYNSVTGATASVVRAGVGIYDVSFPGFEVIADGGNVQVSQTGTSGGYCNVVFWDSAWARVHCFNAAGVASDQQFSVLYLKKRTSTKAVLYAWANDSTSPSYTPNSLYSNNPVGGAITAQRFGPGVYGMTWNGASEIAAGGGHVQVTAYGPGNRRCKVGSWGLDSVDVLCFDAAGNPADSAYTVLYLRPRSQDEGLAFAWANQQFATSPYTPFPLYAFNPAGLAPTATRIALGTYDLTFENFNTQGTGGGHVQVTAYGSGDTRCVTYGFTAELVRVHCFDSAGALVDSRFDVLSLRPIALPEPGIGAGLAAATLGLAFLRCRRGPANERRDRGSLDAPRERQPRHTAAIDLCSPADAIRPLE
ncbi:MAG: FG-GAP repeat protein [Deltaproteobacteria bacterium]|nr:FG-GAP repeat protein [Deltaproteobacteria bacterium]